MLWLFVIMLILFALSAPIAWSMAIAATVYMAFGPQIPLQGMVQRMIGGIDTFPLLAIPFFILAGNLMNTGGITDRLVQLARALVGHIRGGLAHVVVVTNMIMAGMSGSGVADAAGSGTVLIPAMKKVGSSCKALRKAARASSWRPSSAYLIPSAFRALALPVASLDSCKALTLSKHPLASSDLPEAAYPAIRPSTRESSRPPTPVASPAEYMLALLVC